MHNEAHGFKKTGDHMEQMPTFEYLSIEKNEGGTVTSRLSRADYDTAQSQQFVEESFSGSLPAFITAFTRRKKLTEDEIAELQKLIDQNRR